MQKRATTLVTPQPIRTNINLNRELETAIDLARLAGSAAMKFYDSPLDIQLKDKHDEPVTQADYAANAVIVPRLISLFPDDGLLSEETADTTARLAKPRVWMIDPIDGTNGFINRNGDFAVQIGLTIEGTPALGVVYQPIDDTLYYAAKNSGAWTQHGTDKPRRLHVSDKRDLHDMHLAASRSHRSPRMNQVVEHLGLKSETQRGSVGVKIGLIIERQCDLYIHLSARSKQWDTCAPEAILREAGGTLTDLFGTPYEYNTRDVWNSNGIVATNGAAHNLVIERLAPLLREFGRTPA